MKRARKMEIYIQSPLGGNITPEQVEAKIPEGRAGGPEPDLVGPRGRNRRGGDLAGRPVKRAVREHPDAGLCRGTDDREKSRRSGGVSGRSRFFACSFKTSQTIDSTTLRR